MSLHELAALIRQLTAENKNTLALVGGEPTEHPHFTEAVAMARRANLKLRVFSNGDIPPHCLNALRELPAEACHIVLNANASGLLEAKASRRVGDVLRCLGTRASLGVTLTSSVFDAGLLLAHYDHFNLRRQLRIGLAQPRAGEFSPCVVEYREPSLAARVTDLALRAHQQGLVVDYDCGFVVCMFDDAQRHALESLGIFPSCVCNPIPDIAASNKAWPCFPLSARYQVEPVTGQRLSEVRQTLNQRLRVFSRVGLYSECHACLWLANQSCRGGCVARIINTFERLAP
jgi:hypothetical protein